MLIITSVDVMQTIGFILFEGANILFDGHVGVLIRSIDVLDVRVGEGVIEDDRVRLGHGEEGSQGGLEVPHLLAVKGLKDRPFWMSCSRPSMVVNLPPSVPSVSSRPTEGMKKPAVSDLRMSRLRSSGLEIKRVIFFPLGETPPPPLTSLDL